MSRPDLFSHRIGDTYVALVEVRHPSLPESILAVTDNQDLYCLGRTWKASRINLRLPNEIEGTRTAQISVQNVDRRIGEGARRMITPAKVFFKMVAVEDPETIVVDYPPMHITHCTGDAAMVTGDLTSVINPTDPCPNVRATKDIAPAIYR